MKMLCFGDGLAYGSSQCPYAGLFLSVNISRRQAVLENLQGPRGTVCNLPPKSLRKQMREPQYLAKVSGLPVYFILFSLFV